MDRTARAIGELILAALAQVPDMERNRIKERVPAALGKARDSLAATGRTHNGKTSLDRPKVYDGAALVQWRQKQGAGNIATARHFDFRRQP